MEITSKRKPGLFVGPLLCIILLLFPPPEGLSLAGWRTAALGTWMATWWITEAIPLAATSLLPIVALPLLQAGTIREATLPFADPVIFLFMGGFMIAIAMQRWNLHRRIALHILQGVGTSTLRVLLGFSLATAFLSMWISNTATTMMMLPLAVSILEFHFQHEGKTPVTLNFARVLLLTIAYSASIGGVGTLIGTPPNALLAGFLLENYHMEIGFAQWMAIGVPFVLLMLPLMLFLLSRWIFPVARAQVAGGEHLILQELQKMGPMSAPERKVLWVFVGVVILWMIRQPLSQVLPGLSDAGIAIAGAVVLFTLPAGPRTRVLNWEWASRIPWDILLLFGGGLSLASAIQRNGLAEWLGTQTAGLGHWPLPAIVLLITTFIVLLTELTSNTATTAAFLPIVASVAVGLGYSPLTLAIPTAIGASCAFMLPVATPPNAIVFGSGYLNIKDMTRAGIWLNVVSILIITLLSVLWAPFVLDRLLHL